VTGEMAELDGGEAWRDDAATADGPAANGELPRLLPSAPVRELRVHEARYGQPGLRHTPLIDEVTRAGLTGRGGAAYPAGAKLSSVRKRAGLRGAVVVANGMESEPLSAKDAALLVRVPHLVLDGIALTAQAVGARSAYLCVRRPAQAEMLSAAIAERGGRDPAAVKLVLVPERYVSSAESALVRYLNGGPALPGFIPPRPSEHGVRGRPTLVSNVETLANIALISRHGAGWFRSVGTGTAPGSALVTVAGAVRRPGVHEIPFGVPVRDVLELAGGCAEIGGVQAVLAGGFFGSWLPGGAALGTPAAPGALREAGAGFGAGVFLVLPAGGCGLAETARVLRYLAEQSAGQCGPCVNGLPAIADAFAKLAFGRGPHHRTVRGLHELFGLVDGRGACHLPDGVARLGVSTLAVFAEDLRRHDRGPCLAAHGAAAFPVPSVPPAAERRQAVRRAATSWRGSSAAQEVHP
jgi:NADH:ubiquinone oxidoreductase subunit F (NADH-binding)